MPVQLYDTQSRTIKTLAPKNGQPLCFYCCGPTVYGPAHIGNFRTFLIQDVLARVVRANGITVKHVRNITDIDDKTIRCSTEKGIPLRKFTAGWIDKFHSDCEALNMLPPCLEPSAIDHIPQQIKLIEVLIDKGHAYATDDGSVYFSVRSFDSYGRLSGSKQCNLKTQSENSAGERNDADEYERESASDFALWKHRKPEDGENYWNSPWGEGRPGWHLECSAMIQSSFTGQTIDLHGGGIDLCFPHHENEIAQSECAYEQTFCNHWFHTAHLMVEGEKMSKSLGNLYTLEDLKTKGFHPTVVRYALIAGSYRQPLNFTFDSLHAAQSALHRIERFVESLLTLSNESKDSFVSYVRADATEDFGPLADAWKALCHDLNIPACLGALFGFIGSNPTTSFNASDAQMLLKSLGKVIYALGLQLFNSDERPVDTPPEIMALAQERWEAKQAKNWSTADELRKRLMAEGWQINDQKDGFELKRV